MDLEQCIEDAGLNTYKAAKEFGVAYATMHKWVTKSVIPGRTWARRLKARFPKLDMNQFYFNE